MKAERTFKITYQNFLKNRNYKNTLNQFWCRNFRNRSVQCTWLSPVFYMDKKFGPLDKSITIDINRD